MIKLIGALLIVLSGTLIGFQQASRYALRPKQLRQLAHALQRLETEIGYGHTPLPQALLRTADDSPEPIAFMLRSAAEGLTRAEEPSFRESWDAAIHGSWNETAMRSNEQGVLLRLGTTLGISDKEDQMKHLRLALLQLKTEEDGARDDQAKYEKMWKSLGLLSGVLIVILMM